jgi:hypothetical protein
VLGNRHSLRHANHLNSAKYIMNQDSIRFECLSCRHGMSAIPSEVGQTASCPTFNKPLGISGYQNVPSSILHGLCLFALIFGFLGPGVIETPAAIIQVDHSATGLNNGSSWQDAFTDLAEACNLAAEADEIWVAEGT